MPPKPAKKEKEPEPEAPPPPAVLEPIHGKFFYMDGASYEGTYVEKPAEPVPEGAEAGAEPPPPIRLRHGAGKHIDGEYSYDGEWKEDAMHGKGTFKYASGAVYEGEWVNNKYEGFGKYTWPTGTSYEGQWVDNVMHGEGTFCDTDGNKWTGKFYNGAGPGLTKLLL